MTTCAAARTICTEYSHRALYTGHTGLDGAPLCEPTFSTALTTSMPSSTCHVDAAQYGDRGVGPNGPDRTLPKTTCLPSSHGVFTVQMKNCEPLVPGPALAIESTPSPVCLSLKFSSANFSP